MSLQFKDFVPAVVSGNFFNSEYATVEETVQRANDWIAENKVRVINVETILRPASIDDEPSDGSKVSFAAQTNDWYQFIRVWYTTGQ